MEKGIKRPGTESMASVLIKVCFKKHCNLCKKHDGAYTMHNNPTRTLPTRTRKESRDLVLSLWPEAPRKLAPSSIETSARSMGACKLCTT
jgi:hypothetical protein